MTDNVKPPFAECRRTSPHCLLMIIGVGASAFAVGFGPRVLSSCFGSDSGIAMVARVLLIVVGLLATGAAVALRPRSPLALGAVAGVSAIMAIALPGNWDTLQMALRVAATVAGVSALLVLMPRRVQRFAVSLAILFHFGGIATAITSVPPPFGPAPWLPTQLWTRIYRPYFQFMYMYNAYHFYSPDPGPASILWVCIDYSDGTQAWHSLPNRQQHMKDPLALAYYRRLSINESVNQLIQTNHVSPSAVEIRRLAGLLMDLPTPDRIAELVPNIAQYRAPTDYARRLLRSYARFLAQDNRHPDASVAVTGVKIYRVSHMMVQPDQLLAGKKPTDPELFLPYFQGDFDVDGNLKNPSDPMLYWLLPNITIRHVSEPVRPAGQGDGTAPEGGMPRYETINCVEIHARAQPGRIRP